MKIIAMYLNFFLILAASQAGGDTNFYPTGTKSLPGDGTFIEGRVFDKETDLAIAGVIVRWKGTSHSVLTDAEGRYRISPHTGINKLVFSKPGWNDKTFRARKKGSRDIHLKKLEKEPLPAQPAEDMPPDSLAWIH